MMSIHIMRTHHQPCVRMSHAFMRTHEMNMHIHHNQNTHIYFMHAYSPLFKNKHSLHFKLNDTLATKCLMIKIKMM